jgi:hypothetical protein
VSARDRRSLAAGLAAALVALASQPSAAADPGAVKIAVFDFELDDRSAAQGLVSQNAVDMENLRASTEEARRMLSASGRYSIVDASGSADEVAAAGGIQYCNGCEVALARDLGADQAMVGVIKRVSQTEYTSRFSSGTARPARSFPTISRASGWARTTPGRVASRG